MNDSRRIPSAIALGLLFFSSTACSVASYDEKMAYLRTVAKRGVEIHNLLASQGAAIDAKRCTTAYEGLNDDLPRDEVTDGLSQEWMTQVQTFFVDSCVSGLPKPVPGQMPAPPQSPTPSGSPSPSVSSN
ncbi:hypothetical protein ACFYY8_33385 [Streptosporangium sp. NPDC001559]|uniref:hypothetical protein n=1 Tax=Streptosporangium sp. NPDC001559 TaxID=3366187 RepID=UPI0036EB5EAE